MKNEKRKNGKTKKRKNIKMKKRKNEKTKKRKNEKTKKRKTKIILRVGQRLVFSSRFFGCYDGSMIKLSHNNLFYAKAL
jgi:hypothetical protein